MMYRFIGDLLYGGGCFVVGVLYAKGRWPDLVEAIVLVGIMAIGALIEAIGEGQDEA